MIRIFFQKAMLFLILFFIHGDISPFLGKILISAIIIYALIYIAFLKERIHVIMVTVSNVCRLRSYQRLNNKISRIIIKEFEKSYTFLLYIKYRHFVFSILENQRDQADQYMIINPIKPITKLFALKIFQDAFKNICVQFWRLKYGETNIEAIKNRITIEERNIARYFARYVPELNWFYPFQQN